METRDRLGTGMDTRGMGTRDRLGMSFRSESGLEFWWRGCDHGCFGVALHLANGPNYTSAQGCRRKVHQRNWHQLLGGHVWRQQHNRGSDGCVGSCNHVLLLPCPNDHQGLAVNQD